MDPEIVQSRKPPEFLDLLPAVDLGGGHVEARQTGGNVVQLLEVGQVSNGTLRQTEELNPAISNIKTQVVLAGSLEDCPLQRSQIQIEAHGVANASSLMP